MVIGIASGFDQNFILTTNSKYYCSGIGTIAIKIHLGVNFFLSYMFLRLIKSC